MKRKDVYAMIHGYDNAFTDALSSGESVLFSGIQNIGKYFLCVVIIMTILIIAECVLFYFCRTAALPYAVMVLPIIVIFPVLKKKADNGNIRDGYAITEKRVLIYTGGSLVQARFEDITDIVIYSVKGKNGTLEIYKKDPSEAGKTMSGGIIRDVFHPEEIRSGILSLCGNDTPDE